MTSGVYIRTEETIKKIRESHNRPEYIKNMRKKSSGRVVSEETSNKIRMSKLGRKLSEENRLKIKESHNTLEFKEKISKANLGRKHTPETIQKVKDGLNRPEVKERLRKLRIGRKRSAEAIAKLKKTMSTPEYKERASKSHMGKKRSPEAIAKLKKTMGTPEFRKKMSELASGEKSSNWQGGISKLPYAFDFNNELTEFIHDRDSHVCLICSITEEEHIKEYDCAFHTHHIDYDKLNSNPNNLITLCVSCHTKTNGKRKRDYWKELFINLLKSKDLYDWELEFVPSSWFQTDDIPIPIIPKEEDTYNKIDMSIFA